MTLRGISAAHPLMRKTLYFFLSNTEIDLLPKYAQNSIQILILSVLVAKTATPICQKSIMGFCLDEVTSQLDFY